jgi:hypothetical protein
VSHAALLTVDGCSVYFPVPGSVIARQFGRQKDVDAFHRFKKMRDDLVHGTTRRVSLQVTIGEESYDLEELVAQYVSRAMLDG